MPQAVELTWTATQDPELGFHVYRSTGGGRFPINFERISTVPPDERLYRDRNESTDYEYAVTAFNNTGESDPQFIYPDVTGDAVELTWSATQDPQLGFRIYRSSGGGRFPVNFEQISTVPPDERLYRDRNDVTDYEYAVTAFSSTGESDPQFIYPEFDTGFSVLVDGQEVTILLDGAEATPLIDGSGP